MNVPEGKPSLVDIPDRESEAAEQSGPGGWKSFRQHIEEYWRVHVLRLLAESPGYLSNSDVLRDGLSSRGLDVSFRDMLSLVDWLAGHGLVETNGENPRVVRLTRLGLDVAEGRERPPGIARVPPGS